MKKMAVCRQFSETGLMHSRQGTENQDCIQYLETPEYTAAVLADGVSSCRFGGVGARIACKELTAPLAEHGALFLKCPDNKLPALLLAQVRHGLEAQRGRNPLREYASTLAGALTENRTGRLLFFSLGDSLALYTKNGKCFMLDKPEDSSCGIHATVSPDAAEHTRIRRLEPEEYDAVTVFSDGAWRLLYNDSGSLLPQAKNMLIRQDYEGLNWFLRRADGSDDHSYVSVIRRVVQKEEETELEL